MILIPVFILSVLMLFHLYSLRKHDKALYSLYQTRREIMGYLRENHERITRKDYIQIKQSLDKVNENIQRQKALH